MQDATGTAPAAATGAAPAIAAGAVPTTAAGAVPTTAAGANPYRRALGRLLPAFVAAGLFSAGINVLMLTGSIYMLQVYDRVLASGSVPTLAGLFVMVVVAYGFLAVYDMLRGRVLARAATRLDLSLGGPVFGDWIGAPGARGGALRNLETVRGFLSGPGVNGLFDLPWMPLYLGVLFLVHPWLGWLTLAGAGVVAGVALLTRALTRRAVPRAMALEGAARDFAGRAGTEAEAIRAMGMTGRVTQVWQRLHWTALAAQQRGNDPAQATAAFSRAFRMLLQSAILTMGAFLVLQGSISAGMIIASSILAGRALAPVDAVIGQWTGIARAAEAHRALRAHFADRPAAATPVELPAPSGRVEVTRLTRLAPGRPNQAEADRRRLLDQVSFALSPGDGLGVIGSSASGKSTLARLLAGAADPDSGEIRLDGATRDQWAPEVLGRSIGYLPQQVGMLPGTIRDNIARFDPEAPASAVISAARMCGVHEMILALPDGYDTRLGGDDVALSGGQMQRLGLARAVFGMPKLVILDEPNANLDAEGDIALTEAMQALRAAGSTVVVMAHRPSAIAAVNKVLVLHQGQAVRFGPRDEVLTSATAPGAASAGPGQSPGTRSGPGALAAAKARAKARGSGRPALQPVGDGVLATPVAADPLADPAGPARAAEGAAPGLGQGPGHNMGQNIGADMDGAMNGGPVRGRPSAGIADKLARLRAAATEAATGSAAGSVGGAATGFPDRTAAGGDMQADTRACTGADTRADTRADTGAEARARADWTADLAADLAAPPAETAAGTADMTVTPLTATAGKGRAS